MSLFVSNICKTSISNIFHNMGLGAEHVNVHLAEEWLKSNMPDGKITDKVAKFLFSESKSRLHGSTVENLVPALHKFTSLLQENSSLLVSMLVYFKYTWDDANSIVSLFINELNSCDVQLQTIPTSFKLSTFYLSILEFSEECRSIARNLYSGNYIVRRCLKSDPLIPFYCLLAQLCHSAGLEERINIDIVGNGEECHLIQYLGEHKNKHCPMIITEDADVDSAVDAFTESVCQHQREVAWSVSHVFIQESMYEVAVILLKERLKKVVYGPRIDKSTELQCSESKADLTVDECKHLKIFKPFNESPIKICIGWSPNDVDRCQTFNKSCGYIVVVPYRNNAELQALLKENIGLNSWSCSLWSEKFSVKKVLSQLQFSTCWINCHGLIHPLLPFNCLPSIVQTLETVLNNDIDPSNKFTDTTEKAFTIDAQLSRCFPSALLSAIKGFKEWQKFKIGEKFAVLTKMHKMFSSCCLNSQEECCKTPFEESVVKGLIDDMIGFPSIHCDLNQKLSSIGVIIFYLQRCEKIVHLNRFKRLIACSLYHGNSVVLHSDSVSKDCLNQFKNEKSALLETKLPKQAVNFVTEFDENVEKSKSLIIKELSSGPCPFAKVIIVGDSPKDPVTQWSDHSTVSISLSDSSLDDYMTITSLTTLSKSILTYV